MKEIGGYFELELPMKEEKFLHSDGILLNSGRHALEYILLGLLPSIKKIYLPYYTCGVVLEPIKRLNIEYEFYHINYNFEIEKFPELTEGEYIIVNNYFGIKDEYVRNLPQKYHDHIILDQAQAWYSPEISGIKAFYSPRKFFGIPDGGIAFGIKNKTLDLTLERDLSYGRFHHLLMRHELPASDGYESFRQTAANLSSEPLKRMSLLTESLLGSINMGKIKERRRENFSILHQSLRYKNKLSIPPCQEFECAMVYPYLTDNSNLRDKLISHKIFVARYWPDVTERVNKNSIEYKLTKNLLALPIDQRYGETEMKRIISHINE